MKRIIFVLVVIFALCSCKEKNKNEITEKKLSNHSVSIEKTPDNVLEEPVKKTEIKSNNEQPSYSSVLSNYLNITNYRQWDTESQREALENIYSTGIEHEYILLTKHLLDIKLSEKTIGKELNFYNPLNIPAMNNDVDLVKNLCETYPPLPTLQTVNFFVSSDSPLYPISFAIKSDSLDSTKYLLDMKEEYTKEEYYAGEMYSGWPLNRMPLAKTTAMQDLLTSYGYEKEIALKHPERGKTLVDIEVREQPDDSFNGVSVEQDVEFLVTKVLSLIPESGKYSRWIYIETTNEVKGWIFNTGTDDKKLIFLDESPI